MPSAGGGMPSPQSSNTGPSDTIVFALGVRWKGLVIRLHTEQRSEKVKQPPAIPRVIMPTKAKRMQDINASSVGKEEPRAAKSHVEMGMVTCLVFWPAGSCSWRNHAPGPSAGQTRLESKREAHGFFPWAWQTHNEFANCSVKAG